jgi:hypothetical protein
VFDLTSDLFACGTGILEDDFSDCSRTRMLVHGDVDILPARFGVEDAVSIHPALRDILDDIEDNPSIRTLDQFVVTDVWKEVGLHDAQGESTCHDAYV